MVTYFVFSSIVILVKGVISKDCTDCVEYKLCPTAINLVLNKAEKTFREAVCDYGLINGTSSLKVCCSMLQEHAADVQKFNALPDQCGEIRDDRLLRGPVVNLFDYEWLAVFYKSNGHDHCTGSIITPRYILTAARCVKDTNITTVRIGEYNLSTDMDCVEDGGTYCTSGQTDMIVEKAIPHEGFRFHQLGNDIALIRLKASIDLKSGDTLCLPKYPATHDLHWFNNLALKVGWGVSHTVPLKSYLRGFNDTMCNDFYKRYPNLKNNTFCARDLYDNTNLDPGSPLLSRSMFGQIPSYAQYGILSQEIGKQHNIYTDVTKYMAWILKTLRELD